MFLRKISYTHIFSRLLLFSYIVFAAGCGTVLVRDSDSFLSHLATRKVVELDQKTQKESDAFYNYLVGELAFQQQDFDTAERSFAKASQLTEQPAPAIHEKLAEMYVRSGKLTEAMQESQRLLEAEPDNIEYRLLHAGILESGNKLAEAIKIYEEILSNYPEQSETYVLLASVYAKNQNLLAAEQVLEKGVKQHPDNMLIAYNLGRISEAQKNTKKALSYYLLAYEQDPQNSLVVPDIIRSYVILEDSIGVEKFCRQVLERQPQNVLARQLLSQILLGKSELGEALEQFSMLEDMQEKLASDTRLRIAKIQMNAQNYKEAQRHLLLILTEDPDHSEARFLLASVYSNTGRTADAFTEIKKIKPKSNFYARAKVFEGFLYRQEGDSEQAEESFRTIQAVEPNDVKIIYYLIAVLKDRKKYDEADKFFIKALQLKPDNERLLFQHAVLLHEMGRSAESEKKMQRVLEINQDNTDALNFVAYSWAEQGINLEQALKKIQRALGLTPNEPYYLDTLGWVYFKMGDLNKAKQYINESLQQLPSDPEINEHYADVLNADKDYQQAYQFYKKVIELLDMQEKVSTNRQQRERVNSKISQLKKILKP